MPTYSKSLFVGGYSTAGSFATIYTAPPGTTSVVRDIEATVQSGNSLRVRWFLLRAGGAFEVIQWALGGPSWFRWHGRLVMKAGDELQVLTDVAALHIAVSGYELGP